MLCYGVIFLTWQTGVDSSHPGVINQSVCVIVCAHSNDVSVAVWSRQRLWGSEISLWVCERSSKG